MLQRQGEEDDSELANMDENKVDLVLLALTL